MSIVTRATRIITSPATEWPVIGGEPATTGSVMTYAAILSAIAQVCGLVGSLMMQGAMTAGMGMPASSVGLGTGGLIATSVAGWVIGLIILYVMALIAGALARSFDGRNDTLQALKLVVYAGTPVWVFGFLSIIPFIGWLAVIAGYIYAIYLIYRGAPHTVGVPESKAGGYTAVVAIIWLILSMVIGGLVAAAVVGAMFAGQTGLTF